MKKNYIVPLTKTVSVSPRSHLLVVTSGEKNTTGQIDDMGEIIEEEDAVNSYLMYPNYY